MSTRILDELDKNDSIFDETLVQEEPEDNKDEFDDEYNEDDDEIFDPEDDEEWEKRWGA